MKAKLSKLENMLKSSISGPDILFDGITIDSRTAIPGNLFIALRGEKYDGHDYINQAIQNGAVAVITEVDASAVPFIKVSDTLRALTRIASEYSKEINPITISVTGTNGKTTVTDMTYRIVSNYKKTIKTFKNFNNNIGLPLSILRANRSDDIFVLEMGASRVGDIRELVEIARPNIVALLNVSAAHLESFGSLENILLTKEEIFLNQGQDKTVIINKSDEYYDRWIKKNSSNIIKTISLTDDADYSMLDFSSNEMTVKTPFEDKIEFKINNSESFNLLNILYSIGLACEAGARSEHIISAFDNYRDVEGRSKIYEGINNAKIIDSTYNANPASFKASIDLLTSMNSKSWVIMGQMGELGANSEKYHTELAAYAADKGVEKLFVLTDHNEAISDAFGKNSYLFDKKSDLISEIKLLIQKDTYVLVKASRYMKFETIVRELIS